MTRRRLPIDSRSEPCPNPTQSIPVLSKDVPINQSKNTSIRLFLPKQAAINSSPPPKLPLLIYFHGGGFVLCNPASTIFHDYCSNAALQLPAVVASVGYRLAPEHRLPAAYDDGEEGLRWLASHAEEEPWLRDHADYGNCFLMGNSAGGNLAYHVALRAANGIAAGQLKIRGVILHHAFFGGVERTGSEERLAVNPMLPLESADMAWEMCLPVGADRDHEYCNPMAGGGSELLEKLRAVGCRVAVIAYEGDPLVDRSKEVVRMMEDKGIDVVAHFESGGSHGLEIMDAEKGKEFNGGVLKKFVQSCLAA
ncbi:unnamed protein product [Linum tenue]|nr:unnamed protein product [Linum tenue]